MGKHNNKNPKPKSVKVRTEAQIVERVIQFLQRNKGNVYKQKKIAKEIGISSNKYVRFKQILKELALDGEIENPRAGWYRIPDESRFMEGIILFSGRGFAFVNTDAGEEIFVGAKQTANALHLDRVLIEKLRHSNGIRPEGRVVKVLKRGQKSIIGTIKQKNKRWFVIPEHPTAVEEIELVGSEKGLQEGQLVEIQDIEWSNTRLRPRAALKQILGSPENPQDDLIIVKKMYRLSDRFPAKVWQEAELLENQKIKPDNRLDLRDKLIFTIDPPDAKDFDDAISLEKSPEGNWLLGVHIADVSHYVTPGSALDREARRRGTSVYLGENVIPMLPPPISNELCSLKPGEDRLAFSVFLTLNDAGAVLRYSFAPSIIRSFKRFSYEEVQEILDNKSGEYFDIFTNMLQISRTLFDRRRAAGSIDFDIPEPVFKMGPAGIPIEISPSERLDSHRIIEEFMLTANRAVAEYITIQRRNEKLPFLYRIHPQPPLQNITELYQILRGLGIDLQQPPKLKPIDIQKILNGLAGMPYKNFIEQITLRSMAKAVYSQQPLSHFGLAFSHYTHFTAPIRRYPDLMVHRLLKNYLAGYNPTDLAFYRRSLPHIASSASQREIEAMEAERTYQKIKQVRFMADKIGQWYKGVISGVREFGFFVEISQFLVEGLVHVRTLADDYYIYDSENFLLRGKNTRRTFRLGDEVMVMVTNVSVRERRIDLEWGE
ncbi:MAG TPA: ribonuclease R [Candidatus Marinimicrobia bacterium]|nr:ribonuclease R [Candidatus Neomarinimicrobiota bacterium]HRS51180.1 ribonuclease R [Candidatus Neomarinimicrobiota bacterium]HRU91581.1 ribonuclease R [Candidatus Neomarinimicrobiota bacterium]